MEAIRAKENKDKKNQDRAGKIIRKLKQELSALGLISLFYFIWFLLNVLLFIPFPILACWMHMTGLSDEMLTLDFDHERSVGDAISSMPDDNSKDIEVQNVDCGLASVLHPEESRIGGGNSGSCSSEVFQVNPVPLSIPTQEKTGDDSEDVELGGFFVEDAESTKTLDAEISAFQHQEKLKELLSDKNLERLDGIWKKVMIVSYHY